MAEHVFHNTKVNDKSNHWSLLLYQESLAIQRYKPELNHGLKASKELIMIFFCVGVMYSGEYDACDVTLSVYPHRASLKNMPDHGGN